MLQSPFQQTMAASVRLLVALFPRAHSEVRETENSHVVGQLLPVHARPCARAVDPCIESRAQALSLPCSIKEWHMSPFFFAEYLIPLAAISVRWQLVSMFARV